MYASGIKAHGGDSFIDRGDPANHDFDKTDLTMDGAFHELDLSGIVDVGAVSVVIKADIVYTAANSSLSLRKLGNSNTKNIGSIVTQVNGAGISGHFVIALTAARKIEYMASAVVWTAINITVVGWLKP